MKKITRLMIKVLVLTLLIVVPMNTALANVSTEKTITILQTSDLHGRIYAYDYATDSVDSDAGLAKIKTLVEQQRAINPNTLLIDCGDTIQDNSASLFHDLPVHPMVEVLNDLKYDVWTLGNHEFNFGLDIVEKNIKGFNGSVLAANIYKEGSEDRYVDAYQIFEVDGVRVAVVGMIPPYVPVWEASTPSHFKGLEFKPVLEETKKVLAEIEGKYDVLIGAYHIGPDGEHGYEGVKEIANACPEFDAILAGHAHADFNEEINGVRIIEPKKYGWALAKIDIKLKQEDDKWVVQSVAGENLETKPVDEDAKLLEDYKAIHTKALEDANTVVGKIASDFVANPDYITGESKVTTMPTIQMEDSALIDLINEVQMHYAGAQISSAAAFKNDMNLLKGDFKKKDVANIYKYPNTLVGVNITGENLKKYMEWSASYYNTYKDGDITISFNPDIRGYNYDMFAGLTYDIDISKDAGSRVTNLMFNGSIIDDETIYKLAVNNYRFGTLMSLKLVTEDDRYYDSYVEFQDAGRIRDLIIKYTKDIKNGELKPSVDNNWKVIGANLDNPHKDEVYKMIKDGKLSIPKSEDERTYNVKSLNVNDLIKEGILTSTETPVVDPQPVVTTPVVVTPAVTTEAKNDIYIVKSGDMLSKIAIKYGLKWEALAEYNKLKNPNLILVGQEIMIPAH